MFILNVSLIPAVSIAILLSLSNLDLDIITSSNTLGYLTSVCYCITVDYISLMCLSMLCFCFITAGVFYWHYFAWHSDYLIVNIQGFVLSMVYLILSSSVVSSFIGWELLGISSFFLILYYSVYYSSRAASVTVLSSRLGDVGFFLFISCVLNDCFSSISVACCIFICFLLISKSAVFPLTSWLLEAMRAPTPVSSLVHSSTLVAAGVVLICRYEHLLINGVYSYVFLIACLCTIIMSATAAFFYCDSKKVIALSTCNNISWCYVYLYNGMMELCLVQLVCHGVFKCVLFCLIGDLLVNSNNSQNKSMHFFFNSPSYSIVINMVCLFISGAPFLGVYFSKHLFIGYMSELESLGLLSLTLVSLSLSFLYTFRLLNVINTELNSSSSGFNNIFYMCINIAPVLLLTNSLVSNSLLEDNLPSLSVSILVNLFIIVMSGIGYAICYSNTSRWNSGLYGQDFLVFDAIIIHSVIENIGYVTSIFRWEASIASYLSGQRSSYKLGLNFLLVVSFLFYLFILV
uniref:NADH:ubiquinone reductase (H(+)-translocating) n=1 Tax=Gyrodactylus brachymystacis TaxID=369907 RepID=A0A1C8FN04_9PLAT|nr:NADH dehydrogenase subunit 5 [Gyrodactylus brachymystacis]AMO02269.1 NADH dehydrogenase subunit 5 [Gyrodactylus brachymystacis]